MPRTALFRTLLLSMSIAALSACGSGDTGSGYAKTSAPMPPIEEMDAAMAQPAPKPLEASDTLTPILPAGGVSSTTTSVVATNTTPVPMPVAQTTAPAAGSMSVEERIARLEQSVGSLRSDYDRIMPAFASLNTTNERIQTLLDEIERETGQRPVVDAAMAPTSTAAPVVKTQTTAVTTTKTAPAIPVAPAATMKTETITTETTKIVTPADAPASAVAAMSEASAPVASAPPAAMSGGANVTGVRIGEHSSKTRLVLDLTGKTKPEFKYDLDNGEKLLLVDLPSTGWTGTVSGKGGAAAPLVEGWSVQKGAAGGSSLAIQLKKNARVLSTQFLPPEGKDPARLVLDIAAGA